MDELLDDRALRRHCRRRLLDDQTVVKWHNCRVD